MKRDTVSVVIYTMLTERAPHARFHALLVNKLTFIQINIIRFDSATLARIYTAYAYNIVSACRVAALLILTISRTGEEKFYRKLAA